MILSLLSISLIWNIIFFLNRFRIKKVYSGLNHRNIEITFPFPEPFERQILAAHKGPEIPGQLGADKGKDNDPDKEDQAGHFNAGHHALQETVVTAHHDAVQQGEYENDQDLLQKVLSGEFGIIYHFEIVIPMLEYFKNGWIGFHDAFLL
jgi:hypothetical protein